MEITPVLIVFDDSFEDFGSNFVSVALTESWTVVVVVLTVVLASFFVELVVLFVERLLFFLICLILVVCVLGLYFVFTFRVCLGSAAFAGSLLFVGIGAQSVER